MRTFWKKKLMEMYLKEVLFSENVIIHEQIFVTCTYAMHCDDLSNTVSISVCACVCVYVTFNKIKYFSHCGRYKYAEASSLSLKVMLYWG